MKIFSHFASHWYLSLLFACVLLYNLVLQGNDNHICQIFGIFLVVRSAMQEVCGRTERRQNTRLRSRFFSRSHNFPYSSSYTKVRVHVTTRSSKTARKLQEKITFSCCWCWLFWEIACRHDWFFPVRSTMLMEDRDEFAAAATCVYKGKRERKRESKRLTHSARENGIEGP